LCYAFGFIILLSFIGDYPTISIFARQGSFDASFVLFTMPYLFVPIGIYFFWKTQKFGWSIIAIWLVLLVVAVVTGYLYELRRYGGFFDRFFPKLGLTHYLVLFFIFGSLLFYINSKKIKEPFHIDDKFQLKVAIMAAFFVLLSLLVIFV